MYVCIDCQFDLYFVPVGLMSKKWKRSIFLFFIVCMHVCRLPVSPISCACGAWLHVWCQRNGKGQFLVFYSSYVRMYVCIDCQFDLYYVPVGCGYWADVKEMEKVNSVFYSPYACM